MWNTEWCHFISHNRCDHWWQNCSFFSNEISHNLFHISLCYEFYDTEECRNLYVDGKKVHKTFLHRRTEMNFLSSSSLLNFQQEIYNLESRVLLLSVISISFLCSTALFSLSFLSLYFTTLDTPLHLLCGGLKWIQYSYFFSLLLDVAHIFLWTMHSFIYFGRLTD